MKRKRENPIVRALSFIYLIKFLVYLCIGLVPSFVDFILLKDPSCPVISIFKVLSKIALRYVYLLNLRIITFTYAYELLFTR